VNNRLAADAHVKRIAFLFFPHPVAQLPGSILPGREALAIAVFGGWSPSLDLVEMKLNPGTTTDGA
jgi:hypothetical protein